MRYASRPTLRDTATMLGRERTRRPDISAILDDVGRVDMSGWPGDMGIQRRGLRDQVYDSVLDLLMSDQVVPGERLGIDSLAAQLKVSPTPVREALVHLERTGLVVREAAKGYRVSEPLGDEQMAELVDARAMLEVQATRWAVASLPDLLPELRRAHTKHEQATAEVLERLQVEPVDLRTYREYFDADAGFHRVIFRFAQNRYLEQMASDLGAHQHRMRQTIVDGEYDVAQALAEHAAILAAAEALDAPATIMAMQDHMAGLRSRSDHGRRRAGAGDTVA